MHIFRVNSVKSSSAYIQTLQPTSKISNQEDTINSSKKLKSNQYTPLNLNLILKYKNKFSQKLIGEIEMKNRYKYLVEFLKENASYSNKDIIQLPNLCLTSIDTDRFKFDENKSIAIINRRNSNGNNYIVDNLLTKLEDETQELIYLYGLKGIGKSYIIYLMVAKLMAMHDKYRVIYINQANQNIIINTIEILKAILLYDYDNDEEFKKEFDKWLDSFKDEDISIFFNNDIYYSKFDMAKKIISNISKFYIRMKKILFVFVFDQINLILQKPDLTEQFKFLESFLASDLKYKKIISVSANNEIMICQEENKFRELYVPESARFSLPTKFNGEEFLYFLSLNDKTSKLLKSKTDIDQVLLITGGVPLELQIFFSSLDAKTLNDLIIDYAVDFVDSEKKNRYSDDQIKHWLEKQTSENKKKALDNVVRSIFKKPLNFNYHRIYDKCVFTVEKENHFYYLKPFSCFAMKRILDNYYADLLNPLDDEFDKIINSESGYSSYTGSNVVAEYIIQSLRIKSKINKNINFKFKIHFFDRNRTVETFTMSKYIVIDYFGLKIPKIEEFDHINWTVNKLYLPLAQNNPNYDMFYYDYDCLNDKKSFYCIQITNQDDPINHMIDNRNDALKSNLELNSAIEAWSDYLPVGTSFIEIWIVSESKLFYTETGHRQNFSDKDAKLLNEKNIVYFHEMNEFDKLANYFNIYERKRLSYSK